VGVNRGGLVVRAGRGKRATGVLDLLVELGKYLDYRNETYRLKGTEADGPQQLRDLLISTMLKVRSKEKGLVFLRPNRAQRAYAQACTKRNIILKARRVRRRREHLRVDRAKWILRPRGMTKVLGKSENRSFAFAQDDKSAQAFAWPRSRMVCKGQVDEYRGTGKHGN